MCVATYMGALRRKRRVSRRHRLAARFEQRIGGQPVRRRAFAMGFHPRDFRFEKADAIIQLVLRIAVEALASQSAGSVAARAGAIIVVHEGQNHRSHACCQHGQRIGEGGRAFLATGLGK